MENEKMDSFEVEEPEQDLSYETILNGRIKLAPGITKINFYCS